MNSHPIFSFGSTIRTRKPTENAEKKKRKEKKAETIGFQFEMNPIPCSPLARLKCTYNQLTLGSHS